MARYYSKRRWGGSMFHQNTHQPGFGLVRSIHPLDSGICVVAMLSGTNYVVARNAAQKARAWHFGPRMGRPGRRGMTSAGMRRTLELLGLHPDPAGLKRVPRRDPRLAPPGCALAVQLGPEPHEKEWVAWDGFHVLDPCYWQAGRQTGARRYWTKRRPATYLHVPDAPNVVRWRS